LEVLQVRSVMPAAEVKQKLAKITARVAKLNAEAKALRSQCDHEGFVVKKSSYFPGGYLNTSYTDYWNECEVCGARSETSTVNHGHYG